MPEPLFKQNHRPEDCNFIKKKETLAHAFSWEFCKTSKNIFSTEHLCTTASGYSCELVKHGHLKKGKIRKALFFILLERLKTKQNKIEMKESLV